MTKQDELIRRNRRHHEELNRKWINGFAWGVLFTCIVFVIVIFLFIVTDRYWGI